MPVNTPGSRGLTPYSSDWIKRLPAKADASPTVTPASATTPPCQTIMRATLPGSAPSARRIPISPVRWLTM